MYRITGIALMLAVCLLVAAPATAQPQTDPPTIVFTCHGYDEGTTRAYNCIPAANEQHLMARFVPPVGARCDQGSVAEFPAGRLVFQIRCFEDPNAGGGSGTPGPGKQLWSAAGQGSMTLSKPEDAARVRLRVEYRAGQSEHIALFCLVPNHVLITVLPVGTYWGAAATTRIIHMPLCTRLTVETDREVAWWLTEELGGTAASLQRDWTQEPGNSDWPAKALADLAVVTELQRRWMDGTPSVPAFAPPQQPPSR